MSTTSGWFFSRSRWAQRLSCAARRRLARRSRSWVDSDASGGAGVGGGDGGDGITSISMVAARDLSAPRRFDNGAIGQLQAITDREARSASCVRPKGELSCASNFPSFGLREKEARVGLSRTRLRQCLVSFVSSFWFFFVSVFPFFFPLHSRTALALACRRLFSDSSRSSRPLRGRDLRLSQPRVGAEF